MNLKQEKGITLIEVLLALTIAAVIGGLVYGVLNQTIFAKEKSESHNVLRQEANILMTKLRAIHEKGGNLEVEKGSGNLEVIFSTNSNLLVDGAMYTIKLDTLKSDAWNIVESLKTNNTTSATFNSDFDIDVSFIIADKNNNEYELKSTLIGKETTQKISLNGAYRFLVNKDVFLYSSSFDVGTNGSPNIYGDGASIVITGKTGLDMSGLKGNSSSVEVTSLYINGPLIRDGNSKLGNIGTEDPRGELYINGDMILTTNGGNKNNKIFGQVYVMGNVNLDGKFDVVDSVKYKGVYSGKETDESKIKHDPNIPPFEFYSFTTRTPEWYKVKTRGYTIHTAVADQSKEVNIGDDSKVYIENKNITAKVNGKNMVVVSEGNIEVNKGGSGVLFAPKGNVTFNTNSNDPFTGIIVAKNIILNKAVLKAPEDIKAFFNTLNIGNDDKFPLIVKQLVN